MSDEVRSCQSCKHHGDYWPMYVGDDWRKWGTIKCFRTGRRHTCEYACRKWELRIAFNGESK